MSEQSSSTPTDRIHRVIDLRIPLPYLLSGVMVVLWALISMYFSVNQLVRDVGDLQITVKSGNSQSTTLAGEIAILRWRVDSLEGVRREPLPTSQPQAEPSKRGGRP
ncbi:hypothetical protein IB236_17480 [Acidovorax sp. ACV02]|uniref:hypothetical protein n=1 Tax=Acidovorax sp. ACV02 TaxID=2769310 RepID=UPI00177E5AA6|nr:hypothetical protein [Acidovorax sp. ACV02]MBD9407140.1 hypothetical protein [Acidovorax sp. ACV02]